MKRVANPLSNRHKALLSQGKTQVRFWRKVDKTLTCWLWVSAKNWRGYGTFFLGDRAMYAHRIAWYLENGEADPQLSIDHLCQNRACVNPLHLRCVSLRENILSGSGPTAVNAKKTRCKCGRPYNTTGSKGERACSHCMVEATLRCRRRKRARESESNEGGHVNERGKGNKASCARQGY